jgi:hypothetical protein
MYGMPSKLWKPLGLKSQIFKFLKIAAEAAPRKDCLRGVLIDRKIAMVAALVKCIDK